MRARPQAPPTGAGQREMQRGGVVTEVEPGSAGAAAGLGPGDRILAIDGHPLRDLIDVQFYSAEEQFELEYEREGQRLRQTVERAYGQPLGLTFVSPTFDDGLRLCNNHCGFCFVRMNPRGMRRSLYVRDDDYRYSFLFGNFVTLTNLRAENWDRLAEQRLSPLYVSVHATDLDLRRRFLGHATAPSVLVQLRRLATLGIEVHTQVVLIPGLNDGPALERTLGDLEALHGEPVRSVGVVPVGLTRFHRGHCRTYAPDEARALLDQVEPWRQRARRESGHAFAYPSDEWYLLAGRPVPPASDYAGFPQVENGVGMVRRLLDEWEALKGSGVLRGLPRRVATLACGTLIAPVLGRIADEWNERSPAQLRLVPVVNRFFGAVTTVSGLLTGQDVMAALEGEDLGELVLVPGAMLTGRYGAGDAPPGVTLDDLSLSDLSDRLGVRSGAAGTLSEVLAALSA